MLQPINVESNDDSKKDLSLSGNLNHIPFYFSGVDLEKYSWGGKRVAGDCEGWHPVAEVCEIKMKKLKAV